MNPAKYAGGSDGRLAMLGRAFVVAAVLDGQQTPVARFEARNL